MSHIMFIAILIFVARCVSSTGAVRRCYRCCFGISDTLNAIQPEQPPQSIAVDGLTLIGIFDASSDNNFSRTDDVMEMLSTPRSDAYSSQSSESSESMIPAMYSNVSYWHYQPTTCCSAKNIIFTMFHYLRIILKQIIGDIASIQIGLCSFKCPESVKDQMAEHRVTLKGMCKQIRKMNPDEITNCNSYALIGQLAELKSGAMLIFEQTKVCEEIGSFGIKFLSVDLIYKILLNQVPQVCLVTVKGVDQQSFLNGFMSLDWIRGRGQAIIDYFQSSVQKKRSNNIKKFSLEMSTFSQSLTKREYLFPFVHAMLIFGNLAKMLNELNESCFDAFITQQIAYNNSLFTTFGVIIPRSIESSMNDQTRGDMQAIHTLISFIEGASINIIEDCNQTIIECTTKHVPAKKFRAHMVANKSVFIAHDNCTNNLNPLLLAHFGDWRGEMFNYSVFEFDTAYIQLMSSDQIKSIQTYRMVQNAYLLMTVTKERYISSDFVRQRTFKEKQNEKNIHEINAYIRFLGVITKEAKMNQSLAPKISEMRAQHKIMKKLRNRLVWELLLLQVCCRCSPKKNQSALMVTPSVTMIAPQRMEKLQMFQRQPLATKIGLIISEIESIRMIIDRLIQMLRSNKKEVYPGRPVSHYPGALPG